ncbi:hypothetical protein BGZ94_005582 [Podila epigama]|nr:hypothetical protein BGZ94_005582 [Podila epigama]
MSKVCMSLESIFAPGMLYVALSRVRRAEHIKILSEPFEESSHFEFAHVSEEMQTHIDPAKERLWRLGEVMLHPSVVHPRPLQEAPSVNDEPCAEFFREPENEESLLQDFDNDDFWLESGSDKDDDIVKEQDDDEEEEKTLVDARKFRRMQK